jgi:transposase
MSEQKAVQHRRKKNQTCGDSVKKIAQASGRSVHTVYTALSGRMRSRPVAGAIDAHYRTLEPAAAADGTGVAR